MPQVMWSDQTLLSSWHSVGLGSLLGPGATSLDPPRLGVAKGQLERRICSDGDNHINNILHCFQSIFPKWYWLTWSVLLKTRLAHLCVSARDAGPVSTETVRDTEERLRGSETRARHWPADCTRDTSTNPSSNPCLLLLLQLPECGRYLLNSEAPRKSDTATQICLCHFFKSRAHDCPVPLTHFNQTISFFLDKFLEWMCLVYVWVSSVILNIFASGGWAV